jgi:hypothetical protein
VNTLTIQGVLARVRDAAGPQSLVDLYGSAVYAPAHAADVDVLVSHKDPTRLATELGFDLIPTTPPRLHGVIYGASVDVLVVNGNSDDARRMRLAPKDGALLAARRTAAFDTAWPHVRRFVRLRALGHNGLGYFGSFGWALLLAVPLAAALHDVDPARVMPAWFQWLAKLSFGSRVDFSGARDSEGAPLYIAAPASPARDVARLTRRAAEHLFSEARMAVSDATTNEDAMNRIVDLAHRPPAGTTLVVSGDDESSRGRYDGMARRLLRDLEALGPTRSWGRFDVTPEGGWQHRITVLRADPARDLVEHWLAISNIDAIVE